MDIEIEDSKPICKKDVLIRLNRIEGQVKGIQRMVEKGASCREVLVQIAAIRSGINKVGGLILENSAIECLLDEDTNLSKEEKLQELISTLNMFLK